jgi:hypothetical protein
MYPCHAGPQLRIPIAIVDVQKNHIRKVIDAACAISATRA